MPDLDLLFGGDLGQTPSGDFNIVSGVEEIIQRLYRTICTNPQTTLADGTISPADYIWDPTYGLGLGTFVAGKMTAQNQAKVTNLITTGITSDPEVDPTFQPTFVFTQQSNTTWIVDATFRVLSQPQPVTISFQIT